MLNIIQSLPLTYQLPSFPRPHIASTPNSLTHQLLTHPLSLYTKTTKAILLIGHSRIIMDAIQEFEQYCALHPDPWLQAIQAIQNQQLQLFVPLSALQATQATQQSTPPTQPAPQEAQKEEDKQPLYQATVEDDTEITAEKKTEQQHGSSMPDSKSTLSSMPRLRATSASRDPAACLSAFFGFLPTSFFALASLLGYIRCMEGMEATGQG